MSGIFLLLRITENLPCSDFSSFDWFSMLSNRFWKAMAGIAMGGASGRGEYVARCGDRQNEYWTRETRARHIRNMSSVTWMRHERSAIEPTFPFLLLDDCANQFFRLSLRICGRPSVCVLLDESGMGCGLLQITSSFRKSKLDHQRAPPHHLVKQEKVPVQVLWYRIVYSVQSTLLDLDWLRIFSQH